MESSSYNSTLRDPPPFRRRSRNRSRSPYSIDRYQPDRHHHGHHSLRDDPYRNREESRSRDDLVSSRRRSPVPPSSAPPMAGSASGNTVNSLSNNLPGNNAPKHQVHTSPAERYPSHDTPGNVNSFTPVNPIPNPLSLDYQVGFNYFAEWWRMDQQVQNANSNSGDRQPPHRRHHDRLRSEREIREERAKERELIQTAYDSYKEKLHIQLARNFVYLHKNEEWFKERYDPVVRTGFRERLSNFRRDAYNTWKGQLESGHFDNFTLEGIYKNESNGSGGVIDKEEGETTAANEVLGVSDLLPAKGGNLPDEASQYPTLLIKTIAPTVSREKMEEFCREHLGNGIGGFKWLSLSDPNPLKKCHRIGWVILNVNNASKMSKLGSGSTDDSNDASAQLQIGDDTIDMGVESGERDTGGEGGDSVSNSGIANNKSSDHVKADHSSFSSIANKALEALNGKTIHDEERGDFTCHVGVHEPPSSSRKKALWDLFSAPERIERDLWFARRLAEKFQKELGSDYDGVEKIESRVEELRREGQLRSPAATAAAPQSDNGVPVNSTSATSEVTKDVEMEANGEESENGEEDPSGESIGIDGANGDVNCDATKADGRVENRRSSESTGVRDDNKSKNGDGEDTEMKDEDDEGLYNDDVDDEDILVQKKKLDLLIEYLRRVFHFCFFCVFESDSIHELMRKCPGGHLRRPRSSLTSAAKLAAKASAVGQTFPVKRSLGVSEEGDCATGGGTTNSTTAANGNGSQTGTNSNSGGGDENNKYMKANVKGHQQLQRASNWVRTYEEKLLQILEPEKADIKKLGGYDISEALEEELIKFVKQEDEAKFRCKVPDCTKLFKGQHFWRKHVEKRHTEFFDRIKSDIELVNAYALDPAHITPPRMDLSMNNGGGGGGFMGGNFGNSNNNFNNINGGRFMLHHHHHHHHPNHHHHHQHHPHPPMGPGGGRGGGVGGGFNVSNPFGNIPGLVPGVSNPAAMAAFFAQNPMQSNIAWSAAAAAAAAATMGMFGDDERHMGVMRRFGPGSGGPGNTGGGGGINRGNNFRGIGNGPYDRIGGVGTGRDMRNTRWNNSGGRLTPPRIGMGGGGGGGMHRMGGGMIGGGGGTRMIVNQESIHQGRSLKSYEDLDATSSGGNGTSNLDY